MTNEDLCELIRENEQRLRRTREADRQLGPLIQIAALKAAVDALSDVCLAMAETGQAKRH